MIGRFLTLARRYGGRNTSIAFWHTPIGQMTYDYASLEGYYIDFRAKTAYAGPFDADGVPMLDYTAPIGLRYNPCAVAQYALGHFQAWRIDGDDAGRDTFLRMADWLCEMAVEEGDAVFWLYDFDLDAYGVDAPWKSGLAQAQAISVLVRAARFCADARRAERYAQIAALAFAGLARDVTEGGLTRREGEDVWLEEVVADRVTAILDGALFALFGVRDYADFASSSVAEALFEAGVETIERRLPDFDLGYWSRADLYIETPPMPASGFYHGLHVHQLRALHARAPKEVLARHADLWEGYSRSRGKRMRALAAKIVFKLRHY